MCGSDGITYDSECKLKAKACKTASGLVKTKDGSCGKDNIYSTSPPPSIIRSFSPTVTLPTHSEMCWIHLKLSSLEAMKLPFSFA